MIKNAMTGQIENDIPQKAMREWKYYTKDITNKEVEDIHWWINCKFDEVCAREEKVQPSGWLGSGFDWDNTPLMVIYKECIRKMPTHTLKEQEEKAGQIFGLFIIKTLIERDDLWLFVKDEKYQSKGIPIRSRIYFKGE